MSHQHSPTFTTPSKSVGFFWSCRAPPEKKERNTTQQQHMAQVVKKYQTRSCNSLSLPETSPPGTGLFSAPNFLKSWVWLELPKPGSCRSRWTPSTSPSTTEFQTCNTFTPRNERNPCFSFNFRNRKETNLRDNHHKNFRDWNLQRINFPTVTISRAKKKWTSTSLNLISFHLTFFGMKLWPSMWPFGFGA